MPTTNPEKEEKKVSDPVLPKPPLEVTSASDWNKKALPAEEGFLLELPSGNVCRVRRTLDMLVLLKAGRIPNPLAGVVQRMIDTKSTEFPTEEMNREMLEQLYDFLAQNAVRMVIEPKFEMPDPRVAGEDGEAYQRRISDWQPSEGAISIFDVDMTDLLYLMAIGQGQAADLASFREEQAASLVTAQNGEGVRKPSSNRSSRRASGKR